MLFQIPTPGSVRVGLSVLGLFAGTAAVAASGNPPQPQPNDLGAALTFTRRRVLDPQNLFFQELGSNERVCSTCHAESSGWSITPRQVQGLFDASEGLHPLFRPNDGSGSPAADVSTLSARRQAYDLLLQRAVIRVGIGVPAGAEFELTQVQDPYNFASRAELSLFRRPLPSANLKFHQLVMWDGRESATGLSAVQALANQAAGATLGHAQAQQRPSDAQLAEIVKFESALFHTQIASEEAGSLLTAGGQGGPKRLAGQKTRAGLNHPFRAGFNPEIFQLFRRWNSSRLPTTLVEAGRQSIARGEQVFNRKTFVVRNAAGFNDQAGGPAITATCGSCHNQPNVGTSTIGACIDIGVSAASRRIPAVPLYNFRDLNSGENRATTDPGRALITGKWSDMDKFKVPSLRGLAARPPYFHDGSAANLEAVVDFYNLRFEINLTSQQRDDLVAFLRAL